MSSESTPLKEPALFEDSSAGIASVLPLLYIVWADAGHTPSQIAELRSRIDAQTWLSTEEREQIRSWLDASDPPSATLCNSWLRAIRTAAEQAPADQYADLADLGSMLGRRAAAESGRDWQEDDVHASLQEMEQSLGIIGQEVVREFIQDRPAVDREFEGHTFDARELQRLLDAPVAETRDRVRNLLQDPLFRYEPHLGTEAYRERVLQWCKRLAGEGIGMLGYPTEVGGGGDPEKFIAAFETLAYHDQSLVVKFGVQFGLFGGSIHQLGTQTHHERFLKRAGTLELPGCFAMSELAHGSNVRELETTAHYEPASEQFIINTPSDRARKEWIGNAAVHGQMATVFAQLYIHGEHYGVHAFLVPIRDESGQPVPRVRIMDNGHKMGLNGVDNGRIWFDNLRIPRDHLLDRFAHVAADGTYDSPIPSAAKRFFTMLGTLVGGRVSVAAAALSAAKSGLTIAIRYGLRRRQFGPKNEPEVPILDYLSHQRRLFPLLANAYALDFAVSHLVEEYAGGDDLEPTEEIENLAAGLKALSTWNTKQTLQMARESSGGQGYLTVNRLSQLIADTEIYTTFEGDNTVLMLQVAKGLLSEFKEEFQDMNFIGTLRYLSRAAATRISEQNPIITRKTGSDHLRSLDFQERAFQQRERSLLRSVARRLRARINTGMNSYDAFIDCQDHLLSLSQAHVENVIHGRFSAGLEECDDEEIRQVLVLLRDLFALYHIEHHRGWYLEQGYMDGGKSKAIRAEINDLCRELRPHARALVDAFGIPDSCIGAPIALGDPSYGA